MIDLSFCFFWLHSSPFSSSSPVPLQSSIYLEFNADIFGHPNIFETFSILLYSIILLYYNHLFYIIFFFLFSTLRFFFILTFLLIFLLRLEIFRNVLLLFKPAYNTCLEYKLMQDLDANFLRLSIRMLQK